MGCVKTGLITTSKKIIFVTNKRYTWITFLSYNVIVRLVCMLLLAVYIATTNLYKEPAWFLWWSSAEQVESCVTAQHCGLAWRLLLSLNSQLWILHGHNSTYCPFGLPLAFHSVTLPTSSSPTPLSWTFSSNDTTIIMPVYNSDNLGRKTIWNGENFLRQGHCYCNV